MNPRPAPLPARHALVLLFGLLFWASPVSADNLNTALDTDEVNFSVGGNGSTAWILDSADTHDGVDSLRSPSVTAPTSEGQNFSFVQTDLTGPAQVKFWWKRQGGGQGLFFLNNSSAGIPLATTSWVQATVNLPAGTHALRWQLELSLQNQDPGQMWLDAIEIIRPPMAITNGSVAVGDVGEVFDWQITTTRPAKTFSASPLPAGLALDSATGRITGVPTIAGETAVQVSVQGPAGSDTGVITFRIFPPAISLTEALDDPGLVWEVWPGTVWRGRQTNASDGEDAAFPDIFPAPSADNPSQMLRTTVTGPETLTFWWKPNADWPNPADRLTLSIDGQLFTKRAVPGLAATAWLDERVVLGPGFHTLTWFHNPGDWSVTGLDQVIRASSGRLCLTGLREATFIAGKPVYHIIETNYPADNFTATGLPPGLSMEADTGVIRGIPVQSGNYLCEITASSSKGNALMTLFVTVTGGDAGNVAGALGQQHRVWESSPAWFRVPPDGIGFNGNSLAPQDTVSFGTTVSGPDTVYFEWDCTYSSFVWGYDSRWALFIDDLPMETLAGDYGKANSPPSFAGYIGWTSVSRVIGPGDHRVKWEYSGYVSRAGNYHYGGRLRSLRFASDVRTYSAWALRANPDGLLANPQADADGDGLDNWSEYAWQTNPMVPDAVLAPPIRRVGRRYDALFPGRPGATDINYSILKSATLETGSWQSAAETIAADLGDTIIVRLPDPAAGTNRSFLKCVAAPVP